MNDNLLEQFGAFLAQSQNKATGTGVGPYVHGPGGLFAALGSDRDVINTLLVPNGLASALPAIGTNDMTPLYPYVTGATSAGAQVEGSCAVAPAAGNLLSGYQTAQFGITQFATRELDITRVGQVVNRGESLDLRFSDSTLALAMGQVWLNISNSTEALKYGREVLIRFADVAREFQKYVSAETYTGTGTGVRFLGLEGIVKVNHLDAHTGLALTALDSDVRDFGNVDIKTQAGGAAIVETLKDIVRNLKNNSTRMGFGRTEFALVMRPQLFTDITDIWPCQSGTSNCTSPNASMNLVVMANENKLASREMQNGGYLWVDGEKIPVITDDFLVETAVPASDPQTYASDIYVIPMRTGEGTPRTYWEYFDYSTGTASAIKDGNLGNFFWTDRGIYLTVQNPVSRWCVDWQSRAELRLRLETPMLASRLIDVASSHTSIYRSSNPADAGYISDGDSGVPIETDPPYQP